MIDYDFDGGPQVAVRALGERARRLRVIRELTQSELAERAGVGSATIQRFESTGHVSTENLFRIAYALGVEGTFGRLFELPKYSSIDEALQRPHKLGKKRVRRRQ
ncbi:MAG: helix-turn-helix transcriptional regulator [Deltaproteobacteria bacterium]|nr:helix-turn-helix transcriptional regulator [Deltaproteobacteria bacterium]